jgi:hypothetical protein
VPEDFKRRESPDVLKGYHKLIKEKEGIKKAAPYFSLFAWGVSEIFTRDVELALFRDIHGLRTVCLFATTQHTNGYLRHANRDFLEIIGPTCGSDKRTQRFPFYIV